jgi:polyhydroxyalkanoate synthesis regulator phasin
MSKSEQLTDILVSVKNGEINPENACEAIKTILNNIKQKQTESHPLETLIRCFEEHNKKLDKIIELLEGQKTRKNLSDIRNMDATKFAEKNGLYPRIYNAIKSDENFNDRKWTVGEIYVHGKRLRHFGKESLKKFRKAVDEHQNT